MKHIAIENELTIFTEKERVQALDAAWGLVKQMRHPFAATFTLRKSAKQVRQFGRILPPTLTGQELEVVWRTFTDNVSKVLYTTRQRKAGIRANAIGQFQLGTLTRLPHCHCFIDNACHLPDNIFVGILKQSWRVTTTLCHYAGPDDLNVAPHKADKGWAVYAWRESYGYELFSGVVNTLPF